MPALKTKQYLVLTLAGAPSVSPGPAVPERRYLKIQNTGANPGRFRFGGATRADGSDMTFAAGQVETFHTGDGLCPSESLNFSSAAATSWAVIEGTITIATNPRRA